MSRSRIAHRTPAWVALGCSLTLGSLAAQEPALEAAPRSAPTASQGLPTPSAPSPSTSPAVGSQPRAPAGAVVEPEILRLPIPWPFRPQEEVFPPGMPPPQGRPTPGSIFDPGATGPGISQEEENFLDGALDPRTGWPFVFLDHFKPRAERVAAFWIVSTRDCPQQMGTDPWACIRVRHFDDRGVLVDADPSVLLAQTAGKPVLIQVQGSLTTPDVALGGLLWTHSWLQKNRAMLPETVVIAFDWPSQRVYRSDIRDINEKGRRAYVAGYHLARFVQAFPSESRICLLGQSYGGRVVPSALHLLGGGSLNSQDHDPQVRLPILRSDLHLRAILLAGSSDHTWLDPGARLDHCLHGCEALLNLYNRRDEALLLYPFLFRSNHHLALGKVGLTNRDLGRLGSLALRYSERDIHDLLGEEHSLLDAVANPQIARAMAFYLWAPDPGAIVAVPGPEPPRPSASRIGGPISRLFRLGGTAN
jgi:hypothetical protein